MNELHNILKENIDWFWNNDPIVETETDLSILWEAFKDWCAPNCLEIFDTFDEETILKEIESYKYFFDVE